MQFPNIGPQTPAYKLCQQAAFAVAEMHARADRAEAALAAAAEPTDTAPFEYAVAIPNTIDHRSAAYAYLTAAHAAIRASQLRATVAETTLAERVATVARLAQ
jgi:hypothetical protein